jgi:PadR family transcriptional regulator AphA
MSPRSALPLRYEFVVLGLVRRQSIHGYELLQRWNDPDGIGMVWRLKPGLLYAALEKLERLGYLQSKVVVGSSFPDRKQFSITPVGEQAFLDWIKTPVTGARDFRQDFLVKLYFLRDIDSASVAALLSKQKTICRTWLNSLGDQRDTSQGYQRQVFSFRIYQVQGILKWLEELSIH